MSEHDKAIALVDRESCAGCEGEHLPLDQCGVIDYFDVGAEALICENFRDAANPTNQATTEQ